MFLHRGKTTDTLVVGEGLVIRRNQADDMLDALLAQDVDTKVPIQQQIDASLMRVPRNDGRLHEPDLCHRGGDLGVFRGLPGPGVGRPQHPDLCNGDRHVLCLKRLLARRLCALHHVTCSQPHRAPAQLR